jgi:hypothetical protein
MSADFSGLHSFVLRFENDASILLTPEWRQWIYIFLRKVLADDG